jgi:hypothetical protein
MQNEKLQIDDSKIAIISFKPKYYWLFKDATITQMPNSEIHKIDKTLESLVLKHNKNQKKVYLNYLEKKKLVVI